VVLRKHWFSWAGEVRSYCFSCRELSGAVWPSLPLNFVTLELAAGRITTTCAYYRNSPLGRGLTWLNAFSAREETKSELTVTFNEMLERLQAAFTSQRASLTTQVTNCGRLLRSSGASGRHSGDDLRTAWTGWVSHRQARSCSVAVNDLLLRSQGKNNRYKAETPWFTDRGVVSNSSNVSRPSNWDAKGLDRINRQRITQVIMNLSPECYSAHHRWRHNCPMTPARLAALSFLVRDTGGHFPHWPGAHLLPLRPRL